MSSTSRRSSIRFGNRGQYHLLAESLVDLESLVDCVLSDLTMDVGQPTLGLHRMRLGDVGMRVLIGDPVPS